MMITTMIAVQRLRAHSSSPAIIILTPSTGIIRVVSHGNDNDNDEEATDDGAVAFIEEEKDGGAVANAATTAARIEWSRSAGSHVITPAVAVAGASAGAGGVPVTVNGAPLRRPTELWAGSRLSVGRSLFFLRPLVDHRDGAALKKEDLEEKQAEAEEEEISAVLSALNIEKATMEAHTALLKRRVLLGHHRDQQGMRVLSAQQQVSRLEREAAGHKQQADAFAARVAAGRRQLRALNGRAAELQG